MGTQSIFLLGQQPYTETSIWLSMVPVVVGGLLAMLGGALPSIFSHFLTTRQTRIAVARSLAGEIAAICAICRQRNYLEHARESLRAVDRYKQPFDIILNAQGDYMRVYTAHAGALGVLPPKLAQRTSQFYTQVQSLLEDTKADTIRSRTAEESMYRLTEQIALLESTLELGEKLAIELERVD